MIISNTSNNWLLEAAAARPLSRAIISKQATLSFHWLFKRSLDTADYLKGKGITRNDNVGILFSHNYEFFVIVNAIWFLGAVPVPLNTRHTSHEISEQIVQAKIKHLIIDKHINNSFKLLNFPDIFYYAPPPAEEISLKENNVADIYKPNPDSTALIMFTSGSSGKPKAVVHTFSSIYSSVLLTESFSNFEHDDILLASLPFYHIGGFMVLMRGLISGTAIAFPESLKFNDFTASLTKYDPTIISIVPTTLFRLTKSYIPPNKNLRYAFLGGGPASDDIIIKAISKGWPIVKVYGSTETCSMVTALSFNEIKEKPSCAGKPLHGVELQISPREQTSDEELGIKSPSLFKEYFNDADITHAKIKDGFYFTGDFGSIDEEGYLYIESRREDIIISGGENISAKEVEAVILQNSSIEDTCVVPVDDNTWGQIVCAVVQLKKGCGLTKEELIEFLSGKTASFKIPKSVVFLEKIPRNELGKIKQKELQRLIQNR